MNLHQFVSGAIGTINPFVPGLIRVSVGYDLVDFKQVPKYVDYPDILMQVQPLTNEDLKHVDSLNIQGTLRSIFINGTFDPIVRKAEKGGDLVILTTGPNVGTWLVKQADQWPDWCKLIVQLQNP